MADGKYKIGSGGKLLLSDSGKAKICGCCGTPPICCQVGNCCFAMHDGSNWYPDITLNKGTRFILGSYTYRIEYYSDAGGVNLIQKNEFTVAPDAGYVYWFYIATPCDNNSLGWVNFDNDGTHNLNGHMKITTYPGANVIYDGSYSATLLLVFSNNVWQAAINGYLFIPSLGGTFTVTGDCRSISSGSYTSSIVFNGGSYERHFVTLSASASSWTNTNCCRREDDTCGSGEASGDGTCV